MDPIKIDHTNTATLRQYVTNLSWALNRAEQGGENETDFFLGELKSVADTLGHDLIARDPVPNTDEIYIAAMQMSGWEKVFMAAMGRSTFHSETRSDMVYQWSVLIEITDFTNLEAQRVIAGLVAKGLILTADEQGLGSLDDMVVGLTEKGTLVWNWRSNNENEFNRT